MEKYLIGGIVGCILGAGGMYMLTPQQPPDPHMMSNDSNMSDTMIDMAASLTGKTGDAFDEAFIEEMIVHHEGAVDMAELALTNAKHEEIKQLAREIIAAQTREITQMKGWLESWY